MIPRVPAPPPASGHGLDDRGGAKAERIPEAGGAVHLTGVRLPRRVMWTKGWPVPAAEYGVVAALARRLRLARHPGRGERR